jgi:hypothetical protein
VSVGRDADVTQIANERFNRDLVGIKSPASREVHQVPRRRPVAADGGERGADDVFVVVDERSLKFSDRNRPEREQGRGAGREFQVDLRGDLFGRLCVVGDGLADGLAVPAVVDPSAPPVLI